MMAHSGLRKPQGPLARSWPRKVSACCIWLCALVVLVARPIPLDAAAVSENDVRRHVEALLENHPSGEVRKWQGKLPYIVIGMITEEELGFLIEKMAYLNQVIGRSVEVERTVDPNAAKLFFIFSDYLADWADKNLVISLLKGNNESLADFQRRLRKPETFMIGRFGSTDGKLEGAAILTEMKGLTEGNRQSRIFEAAFDGVIGTVARSDIRPSIVDKPPRRTKATDRLPTLDEAFLRALYTPQITLGMERQAAEQAITRLIVEDLGSEKSR